MNPISAYMKWCGTRSFVLQTVLLTWTIVCALIGIGILLSTRPNPNDPMMMSPEYRADQQAGWAFAGLCCPTAGWILVALPLFIASIATLGKR